jgi:hypothetical protein
MPKKLNVMKYREALFIFPRSEIFLLVIISVSDISWPCIFLIRFVNHRAVASTNIHEDQRGMDDHKHHMLQTAACVLCLTANHEHGYAVMSFNLLNL